jgi:hypothetical protein
MRVSCLPCCMPMQQGSPLPPQTSLHRTMCETKKRMLKFLVLLAVVASLAVAAPPVVPDFNDLDASPLDASDLDASDLDASDFDASDLGDLDLDGIDDVQEEFVPKVGKTVKEQKRQAERNALLNAILTQKIKPVVPKKPTNKSLSLS